MMIIEDGQRASSIGSGRATFHPEEADDKRCKGVWVTSNQSGGGASGAGRSTGAPGKARGSLHGVQPAGRDERERARQRLCS
jgi:hypothetical protein